MKEFDIEKLKRENIFKTPDSFFEELQKKVLQETIPVKQGKLINLKWAYSAAAAIALLIGMSVLFNADPTVENQLITRIEPVHSDYETNTLSVVKPESKEHEALHILEEDLTLVAEIHQKQHTEHSNLSVNKTVDVENEKEYRKNPTPEVQVDQILANFTSAELATFGRNTEQDIYLDLYN